MPFFKKSCLSVLLIFAVSVQAQTDFYKILEIDYDNSLHGNKRVFVDDLNSDGATDILISENEGYTQYISNGDGSYRSPVSRDGIQSFNVLSHLVDLNQDGFPDLVKKRGIYFGSASGLSQNLVSIGGTLTDGLFCLDRVFIDVVGDGQLDLVCEFLPEFGVRPGHGIRLFENKGEGIFNFVSEASTPANSRSEISYHGMLSGDIDNDGKEDVVSLRLVTNDNDYVRWYGLTKRQMVLASYTQSENGLDLSGNLFDPMFLKDSFEFLRVKSSDLVDANNDGNLDLVILARVGLSGGTSHLEQEPLIFTVPGNGDGTFSNDFVHSYLEYDSTPVSMSMADFNEDGVLDAVVSYTNSVFLQEQLGVSVHYGNGIGGFGEAQRLLPDERNAHGLALGDITGDGQLEIIATTGWSPGKLVALSKDSFNVINDYCTFASSDSDGDGWGWESGKSCLVTGQSLQDGVVEPDVITGPVRRNPSVPLCSRADTDVDGDGWGWENNGSCQVVSSSAPDSVTPVCELDDSDSDNDGWGWENGRSCIVP